MPGIELGLYNNLGFLNIFLLYGLCNDRIGDNSVGVATRQQVHGARNRGLITEKKHPVLIFCTPSINTLGSTQTIQWPKLQADHSLPPSAKAKNEWSSTSTSWPSKV